MPDLYLRESPSASNLPTAADRCCLLATCAVGRELPLVSQQPAPQDTLATQNGFVPNHGGSLLIELQKITHLPPQISALEKQAVAEGFKFLTRLISEWDSGTNRFDAPGECLISAYQGQQLVGIGGLSVDPFTLTATGRLRRVYVLPVSRGQQVGRRLVSALLAHAASHFEYVRLHTDTAGGSTFYLRCGFTLTEDAHATHILQLRNLRL